MDDVVSVLRTLKEFNINLFLKIELLQSSSIYIQFIPEFHSGLIKFNHFVVISSFSADPMYSLLKAIFVC